MDNIIVIMSTKIIFFSSQKTIVQQEVTVLTAWNEADDARNDKYITVNSCTIEHQKGEDLQIQYLAISIVAICKKISCLNIISTFKINLQSLIYRVHHHHHHHLKSIISL